MKRAYEREQKEQMDSEKRKQEEKKLELKETQRILQLQMSSKQLGRTANLEIDKQFRNYLDDTISVLGN